MRPNPICTGSLSMAPGNEQDGELCWQGLSHLKTSEVGGALQRTVRRMLR